MFLSACGKGYGNIDTRLYKASSRVKAPGRDYLLFRGPLDAVMSFLHRDDGFWGYSPNMWWPADRAWCVATDIDLFDTYVGGSTECIEAVLGNPDLEALPTTLDARVDIGGDTDQCRDMRPGTDRPSLAVVEVCRLPGYASQPWFPRSDYQAPDPVADSLPPGAIP